MTTTVKFAKDVIGLETAEGIAVDPVYFNFGDSEKSYRVFKPTNPKTEASFSQGIESFRELPTRAHIEFNGKKYVIWRRDYKRGKLHLKQA